MTDPRDSRLSEADNERIFRDKIVVEQLNDGTPQDRPIAYLLGGQPGAGKSRVEDALMGELAARGGGVKVEADEFRQHHPSYRTFMRDDDRSMSAHTGADAGRWTEKSIDYAAERRVDMVIAGTMRDPEVVAKTAAKLHQAGYRVEAHIMATSEAESRLGILDRYQRQRISSGAGRYTDTAAHDAGYQGVAHTADAIDQRKMVDAVHVHNRDGALLYENELDGAGDWSRPEGTRAAIEAARNQQWSADKTQNFDDKVAKVRDPALPEGQSGDEWRSPRWQSDVDQVQGLSAPVRHRPESDRQRDLDDRVAKAMESSPEDPDQVRRSRPGPTRDLERDDR